MALTPRDDKTGETKQHRARGFESAAAVSRKRLDKAAARHGFAEPEVLLRWAEVVGERLAGLCSPVKVSYPRGHGLGATLVVRSAPARAPEVEHLGPQIVERVNRLYGYRAVSRLKVTQSGAGAQGLAEAPSPFAGPQRNAEPSDEAVARAATLARGIRDDGLRAALTRMGAHVLSRPPGASKSGR